MRSFVTALIGLTLIACGQPSSSVAAVDNTEAAGQANWQVDTDASSVKFRATQNGNEFEGEFKSFTAEIRLAPENLTDAFIRAEIDISSVDAGSDDRNGALPTREWFHVRNFPVATFASDSIQAIGEGQFVAEGELVIKGVARAVSLPFSLEIADGEAEAQAQLDLMRMDYELGPKEDWVGNEVTVQITIYASRKD